MRIQDSGSHEDKIGVELTKEAATESELNSIYLTQLLHDVDHSLVLTLVIVRSCLCIYVSFIELYTNIILMIITMTG